MDTKICGITLRGRLQVADSDLWSYAWHLHQSHGSTTAERRQQRREYYARMLALKPHEIGNLDAIAIQVGMTEHQDIKGLFSRGFL